MRCFEACCEDVAVLNALLGASRPAGDRRVLAALGAWAGVSRSPVFAFLVRFLSMSGVKPIAVITRPCVCGFSS